MTLLIIMTVIFVIGPIASIIALTVGASPRGILKRFSSRRSVDD